VAFSCDHSPTVPSLRQTRPERFTAKVPVDPGVSPSSKHFSLFLSLPFSLSPPNSGGHNSWSGRWSPIFGCYSVCSLFFHLGGGRPLHNVKFLISRKAPNDPAALFPNSSPMVFPKTSLLFLILSSRGCCLMLHPPILFAIFLPFLRCSSS
jgi:hypothetical protein